MSDLTEFIIILILFIGSFLVWVFYMILKDKIKEIKKEKEKTKIEKLDAAIKAHREWQAHNL